MGKKATLLLSSLSIAAVGLFLFVNPGHASAKKLLTLPQRFFHRACDRGGQGVASCDIQVVTDANNKPLVVPTPPADAFGPTQFHTGYNLPCTPGGTVNATCATPATFGPQTIAIVDAYNDPTVENDLSVYSTAYGIPQCTKANGCLTVINQNGGSSLPATNASWALETSLDVQVAHAICQTCKILLVEANSSSIADLGTAVNRAASLGVTAISNSYGASEWSGETGYDTYYNHPGIAVTASSGDSGYGAQYPAASKHVVAVGGTTLQLFADNTYATESVWNGAGSGCSSYEIANSWQTSFLNWIQTGCGSNRGVADVAADADPNSGAAIYDSTSYQGHTGWWIVGGTSLASPLVASEYALGGGVPAGTLASSLLYNNYSSANFHDVTVGSNGNCGTIMCNAGPNYDGPTGLGSLFGIGAVTPNASPTPTVTPTPSVSPSPTATPTPTLTPTPTPIDSINPTVSITQPANNSFVRRGSRVTISVNATDNVKVAKVVVSVAGASATATTAPYNFSWNVPNARNVKYTITATAYDTSNNSATTSISVTAL